MAYYNQQEEGKSSVFNQAIAQMKRMDDKITRIQTLRLNLWAYNDEYLKYNYELVLIDLNSLKEEVVAKMGEVDKKDLETQKRIIEMYIEKNPPILTTRQKIFPYKTKTNINRMSTKILEREIDAYKTKIMIILDRRGFGSPDKEDPSRAVVSN